MDFGDKDKSISYLKSEIKKKEKQIEALRIALAKSQEFIVDVHQSLPLKLFRGYDSSFGKLIPLRLKRSTLSKGKKYRSKSQIIKEFKNYPTNKKDIICFPMINWDYRKQRPQHIFEEFANNGHRVYYFTTKLKPLSTIYEITKLDKNIYQVELTVPKNFDIYKDKINKPILKSLTESFIKLKKDVLNEAICFVMFPTWAPLVLDLMKLFKIKLIFDLVDDTQSFPNINKERKKEERLLLRESDLVIVSSQYLLEKTKKLTKNSIHIPNAVEYDHFSKKETENLLSNIEKPIIGYFGAIAEWFDTDLIGYLAKKRPNYNFVFIGDTYGSNLKKIINLQNIHFLGERPYEELPNYLHHFDACLIPFKLNSLTMASSPIKIYEYFAAGKPVVTTHLPALNSMKNLCYIADNKNDFLTNLDLALNENKSDLVRKRIEFASKNTWQKRFEEMYHIINKICPLQLSSNKTDDIK